MFAARGSTAISVAVRLRAQQTTPHVERWREVDIGASSRQKKAPLKGGAKFHVHQDLSSFAHETARGKRGPPRALLNRRSAATGSVPSVCLGSAQRNKPCKRASRSAKLFLAGRPFPDGRFRPFRRGRGTARQA